MTPIDQPSSGDIERELGLPHTVITQLEQVSRPRDVSGPVLPDDTAADRILETLRVHPQDRATTLAARPDPRRHGALWWVLDRTYHRQLASMGAPPERGYRGWPVLPHHNGPVGRHLYVWLCLALVSHIRGYHTQLGIPETVTWATLAALGDELARSRHLTGTPGLVTTWHLPLLFRGTSYRLGRLAFDRDPAGRIGTHIPASGGPLTPAACDDSFDQARAFFPRHFDEQPGEFGCHSWLMDDQLADYLPETSNIIKFQRRFTSFVDTEEADWAPLEHIFHRRYQGKTDLLNELPQDTTLQRAIITHLRAGRHWYNRTGLMLV